MADRDRFWGKVCKTDDCWLWTGSLDGCGYGMFKIDGQTRRAHRVVYEWTVGTIPEGEVVDHLCRVRNCVRPDHLEAVDQAENMRRARRTHCHEGHELTPDNTYLMRCCKKCKLDRQREQRRLRAA